MAEPLSIQQQESEEEIRRREAEILGSPPRIEPLQPEEYGEDIKDIVSAIGRAAGASQDPDSDDTLADYFATLLRHPRLLKVKLELSLQLYNGTLPVRDREMVILRLAWLCRAPYEWGEHVQVGKRVGGLSSEEIERITAGSNAAGWTDHERGLLRAVEELHGNAMISNDTWTVLARTMDEKQLLELPVLVGTYQTIAYLQNSVGFCLSEDNRGLMSR